MASTEGLVQRLEDLLAKASGLASAGGDEGARELLTSARTDAERGAGSASDMPLLAIAVTILRDPAKSVARATSAMESGGDRPELVSAILYLLLAADVQLK